VNLSWSAAVHPEAAATLSSPDVLPATQIGPFRFQLVRFLPPGGATRCFPVLSNAVALKLIILKECELYLPKANTRALLLFWRTKEMVCSAFDTWNQMNFLNKEFSCLLT
jgi:hypothetical protein